MSDKTILEQWRAMAYDQQADRNKLQQFWAAYFNIEKGIYEQLLSNPDFFCSLYSSLRFSSVKILFH